MSQRKTTNTALRRILSWATLLLLLPCIPGLAQQDEDEAQSRAFVEADRLIRVSQGGRQILLSKDVLETGAVEDAESPGREDAGLGRHAKKV